MSYTEFYVSTGAGASDINGGGTHDDGTGGPATNTTATVNGGALTTIVDDVDSWEGANIGDWVCWDTAGVKELRRITNIVGANATVHAACTAGASKNARVGGHWLTVDFALSTITTAFVNAAGDPPRINVKSGTYSEAATCDNAGTLALPITLEGYETTAGDGCPNGSRPEIDADAVGTALTCAQDYWIFKDLWCHTTGANNHAMTVDTYNWVIKCKCSADLDIALECNDIYAKVIGCEVTDGTRGISLNSRCTAFGCYVHDVSEIGIYLNSWSDAHCCIVDTAGDDCFLVVGDGNSITNCVGYNSTAGSGVKLFDLIGESQTAIMNCIFEANNQYGIESADAGLGWEDYNAFYNNSVGERSNVLQAGPNDVTMTSSAFINAASGDFRLSTTAAGGGLLCKNAAFPGPMLDGTNIGYLDIGALQSI